MGQYTPAGFTAAFVSALSPTVSERLDGFRFKLVGFIFLTVILTVFFTFLFFLDVTVIVAFPAFLPVTIPLDDTVATFLLLDLYFTALLALDGFTDFTVIAAFPFISIFFVVTFNVIFFCSFSAASAVCRLESSPLVCRLFGCQYGSHASGYRKVEEAE